MRKGEMHYAQASSGSSADGGDDEDPEKRILLLQNELHSLMKGKGKGSKGKKGAKGKDDAAGFVAPPVAHQDGGRNPAQDDVGARLGKARSRFATSCHTQPPCQVPCTSTKVAT